MPPFDIITSDVLAWAAHYDGPLFHALLCDPPYHFTSIAKRFGKPGASPAKHGSDGAFARASAGFMGQTWDGGDIAFRPETWAAFMPLLHPGAFGMASAGRRH
jgi:site-specific DNA-methyltransferase (adenine-specific)